MSAQAEAYAGEQRRYVERASVRIPVSIAGKVLSPDLSFFANCVVKDISAGGAMAQVASSAAVPTKVYLWQSQTWTFFECEVRWRKPGQIGLHFIDVASRRKSLALIEQYGLGKLTATPAPPNARAEPTVKTRPLSERQSLPKPKFVGPRVMARSSTLAAAKAAA
jgi:PilZ domain